MKILATLTASLLFAALPAQNTNESAPMASSSLTFDKEHDLTIAYRSFTIAGGNWLRQLNDRGANGKQARKYYNEQYITNYLRGSLKVTKDVELGGNPLSAGTYKVTFRIDDDLVWHFVVLTEKGDQEICAIAMVTDRDDKTASARLSITPVADAEGKQGKLAIHFGPLKSEIAFKLGKPPAKVPPKKG